MSVLPIHSTIFGPLFSDSEIASLFSDETFLQYLLKVEASLAVVQGRLGLIPLEAAQEIVSASSRLEVDVASLEASTEKAGVPVMGLVKQLRKEVGGEIASFVHWGDDDAGYYGYGAGVASWGGVGQDGADDAAGDQRVGSAS